MKPNLIHSTLEPNTHNNNAFTVVVYFDGEATIEQIREVCVEHSLNVDVDDMYFNVNEISTPISRLSGTRRYEVYPTC
jgi:hypothetical protein